MTEEVEAEVFDPLQPGWVRMTHKESGGVQVVTREAFDEVWSEKGWEISAESKHDTQDRVTAPAPPPPADKSTKNADKEA